MGEPDQIKKTIENDPHLSCFDFASTIGVRTLRVDQWQKWARIMSLCWTLAML